MHGRKAMSPGSWLPGKEEIMMWRERLFLSSYGWFWCISDANAAYSLRSLSSTNMKKIKNVVELITFNMILARAWKKKIQAIAGGNSGKILLQDSFHRAPSVYVPVWGWIERFHQMQLVVSDPVSGLMLRASKLHVHGSKTEKITYSVSLRCLQLL